MLVIVESPYSGDIERNLCYARAALKDCFDRGEYPFASHLLYTQKDVLDDNIPEQRQLGILALGKMRAENGCLLRLWNYKRYGTRNTVCKRFQ